MRRNEPKFGLFVWAVLLSMVADIAPTHATQYSVTDLGVGKAFAINASGHVVGESDDVVYDPPFPPLLYPIGFKWDPVTGMNRIVDPLGRQTTIRGINNNGTVVGNVFVPLVSDNVFVWNGAGSIQVLDIIGGNGGPSGWGINDYNPNVPPFWQPSTSCDLDNCIDPRFGNGYPFGSVVGTAIGGAFGPFGRLALNSTATAINSNYWTVGQYQDVKFGTWFAFLWNGISGNVIQLPSRAAYGINDAGVVVGVGFLFDPSNGTTQFLGPLPGFPDFQSEGLSINNHGQAVGYSATVVDFQEYNGPDGLIPGIGGRAFIYDHGVMTDLNDLIAPGSYPWLLGAATGINDNGWIAGYSYDENNVPHAWLLRPAILAGDFDGNGVVNSSDYVVWRKGLGTTYTQSDYDVWRFHFGQSAGGGSGVSAGVSVPEPATLIMLLTGVTEICARRRTKVS